MRFNVNLDELTGCRSIKFTVVSDPPEEAEQEEECEDVGVAYLRIIDILDKQRDMKDVSLNSKCDYPELSA